MMLPWRLRRFALTRLLRWDIHRDAHIGFAFVAPRHLIMREGARIGHLTVCKGIDLLELGPHALIGRANWITGSRTGDPQHYAGDHERIPQLILGEHAAITHRHLVDCTATITVGPYATVAGYRSQLLTHSIDLKSCRQAAKPISIGKYCFVGTDCVLLGGASLPSFSVLGAKSLLNNDFSLTHKIYGGVPATPVAQASSAWRYFEREVGFVA